MTEPRGRAPTALVTGAAGGIGGALFSAFGAAGYQTIGVDCVAADGVVTLDVTDAATVHGVCRRPRRTRRPGQRRRRAQAAALFLAGDGARFITGAVLPVDGGYSVK